MAAEMHPSQRRPNKDPDDNLAISHANPDVGASWQRSLAHGVPQTRLPEIPLVDYDSDSRLLRAARPVLQRLEFGIMDASMSLVLADENACIVDRRVGQRKLTTSLDGATVVPGAIYGEAVVGTNALGMVIETKRPACISGNDHFTEILQDLTCIAVPIMSSTDTRLRGILDITHKAGKVSPLMLPMLLEASHSIGELLAADMSRADRLLMQEFRAAIRHAPRPVVLLEGDLVITNARAAALLRPDDLALLRQHCQEITGSSPRSVELTLLSGTAVLATFRPITDQSMIVGTIIEFASAPVRAQVPRVKQNSHFALNLPGLVGHSSPWREVCHTIQSQVGSDVAIALLGEPGVGKVAVGMALHELRKSRNPEIGPTEIVDASLAVSDHIEWLSTLKAAVRGTGTVVVRHVDLLSPSIAAAAAAIIAARRGDVRLCVTAGKSWRSNAPRVLVDQFPLEINVPALRHRLEDLPDLVDALLQRHGADLRTLQVTSETIALLARSAWPGNLRELEGLLAGLLAKRSKGAITPNDLPIDYRVSGRHTHLTTLEQAEYEAILQALAKCGGNKSDAAFQLGVSRSTLYRKLEAYGIA